MVVEKVFAVIAESTRRDLLEALAQESKSVGQLVDELGVSQPTVSKHLRVLREAGVVTMRAQGQKRYYGINTEPLALVSTWLHSLGAGVVAPVAAAASAGAAVAAVAASSAAATPAPAKPRPVVAPPVVAPEAESEPAAAVQPAPTSQPVPERVSVAAAAARTEPASSPAVQLETVQAPAASVTEASAAASNGAPAPHESAASNGTAAVVPFGSVQSGVVQSNENDGGATGQFSRSVGNAGRLANKAADLLSNLPALPTFKRRKN